MKRHHLAALLALTAPRLAAADPHKLLVLQAEGRVDAATRGKIDAAIFRLALAAEPQATAGELNFTDAATAVGCKPDTASCKEEVLGMLAVDEIVISSVVPKPGGLEITVRRFAHGGATRDATMLLPAGAAPDKLDGIAPLFGDKPAAPAPIGPAPLQPATAGAPVAAIERDAEPPPALPPPTALDHEPRPSPIATPAAAPVVMSDEQPGTRRHRLEIAGMAGGAGMVVLGVVLWGAASGVQSDINHAPTVTKQDLVNLRNLESKGDGYAGVGNLFAIGGVVLGGIATYYYIKDRQAAPATTTARLVPTLLDHGAGVVLTFGGPR